MKKILVGLGFLAGLAALAATPVLAQRVAVDLSYRNGGGVRVAASYASAAAYVRAGHRYCEPEGPYVYCWDVRARRPGRTVAVHVFHNRAYRQGRHYRNQRRAARQAWRMDSRAFRRHVRAAQRAWQRWYRDHHEHRRYVRGAYGRRIIDERPAIAFRLAFHL
jgi:hypothetical protein